jgi:arylsulfatase
VLTPDKPFFVYFAPGATHAPHHAPKKWADKYKGKFDQGYDKLREETLARQKKLGVVPPDCRLTAPNAEVPRWDEMPDEFKPVLSREMEVYAGYLEYTDYHVGKIVDALEKLKILDDTLIFYITGDNGASAEGSINGCFNEMSYFNGLQSLETPEYLTARLDELGGPTSYNHYAVGWALAMNTPYQWTKQVASHWGGTRNGTVVHWPKGIQSKGEIRTQFTHVIDVVPTVLEAAGLPQPESVNGIQQDAIEGVSMAYSFDDANAPERHETQYFEMFGNRGIYHKGWTAVTHHQTPWASSSVKPPAFDDDAWELYSDKDWSQAEDLSKRMPEKLHELQRQFLIEATRYKVLPLDDRMLERINPDTAGRPVLIKGKSQLLVSGMGHLLENCVLNIKNKSHSVTADIVVPEAGAEGVIISQGANIGGWSLYAKDGKLKYCYNWGGFKKFFVESANKLSAGQHQVRMEFDYAGGGLGKGGKAILFVDGTKVGEGDVGATLAMIFSADDGCDVGMDSGAPVSPDYPAAENHFNGEVKGVLLSIEDDPDNADHLMKPEDAIRAALGRQ